MTRIGIDLDRRIGTVDPRIFGQFIEHLGRCIYGGIYDEGSPLSDARGFRRDVLEAARPLRIPVLRWPGGNFVSGYHWLDGVGPEDQRPRRSELAWYAEESNRFGTDEFIAYCRELGTEPFICVNMGTGTMDEAQAWVEYCNGTGNTSWANLRRRARPSRALPRPVLGPRQRDVRELADRQPERPRLRQEGASLRDGHEADRPDHPAGRLRADRLERVGRDRPGRPGRARRLPQHPPLHGHGRSLRHRLPAAPGRARDPDLLGADRARAPRPADRPSDPHRLRRVERLVPDAEPRGPRGRRGGALQPLRRPRGGDLPERLHPALPHRAHRELRPARERDRPDLHEPPGPVSADHLSPAAALRRAQPRDRPRRPRERRDL